MEHRRPRLCSFADVVAISQDGYFSYRWLAPFDTFENR
jgi:hypothetical protein